MKSLLTTASVLLLTISTMAQAPQKMNYQAVVRDNADQLIVNTQVGMQISVLHGSLNGTAVYVETHTPISNTNGLVSLEIGTGTGVTGDFATIDWSSGPYFIKTETDPSGGTNYTISGTNELLSVPFALFAASGTEGPPGPIGPQGLLGPTGPAGPAGVDGNGIISTVDNGNGTFTITYSDSSTFTTSDLTGPQGPAGSVNLYAGDNITISNDTISATPAAVFELNNGVVRSDTGTVDWSTDDFVFGSPQMDDDDNANHDARFFFDKSKEAFRAGSVFGTQWNESNIGTGSVAMGLSTTASAFAAIAMGASTTASGSSAVAMGSGTTASGNNSTAMGNGAMVSGHNSTAMGYNTTASGEASTAMGYNTNANGEYSTAMGHASSAHGARSAAIGSQVTTQADYSMALGRALNTEGKSSVAMGWGIRTFSAAEVALGSFNTEYVANDNANWNANDRVFVVGNGTDNANRSDALVILKNGNVGLGTQAPDYPLTVKGSGNQIYSVWSEDGTQTADNFALQIAPGEGSSTTRGGYLFGDFGSATSGFMIANKRNAPLRFGIGAGPTEVMRLDASGNLGIGTTDPDAKLDVNGSVKITDGTQAEGYVLTSDVAGNASWQPSASLIWGVDTNGTGVYSLLNNGSPNVASGISSFAVGNGNTASGDRSVAMGGNSEASGFQSVAMGNGTKATDHQAVAIGNGTEATANQSVAMGNGSEASGNWSVAIGNSPVATGNGSVAIGNASKAFGNSAVAMGNRTKAQAYSSTAVGSYNSGGGSTTNWVPSDPLFMVGNGTTSADTSNAMTILKNGNTGLGTETPDTTLHVVGKMKYQDGSQSDGYVLTSDAEGNASWQLPSMGSSNQTLTLSDNWLSIENGNSVDLSTGLIENRSPDNTEVEGQVASIDLKGTLETNQLRTFGNVTLGSFNDPSPNTVTVNSNLKVGESGTVLTDIIKVSINRDIANLSGNSTTIETFNVSGAQTGAVVYISPSDNLGNQIVIGQAWVSAAGVVSVKLRNTDGGGQNPPQMDYNIVVIN